MHSSHPVGPQRYFCFDEKILTRRAKQGYYAIVDVVPGVHIGRSLLHIGGAP
ncbi:hypothetical protein ABIG06_005132 [Bradyrhizobium sp. USDA 326]